MAEFRLETERLVLRTWCEADLGPLTSMNSDPEVMTYIGPPRSRDENLDLIRSFTAMQQEHGYACWALECRANGALIGFCGMHPGAKGTPVEGEVEIAWRLVRDAWGRGFAKEAALACIDWGFANLDIGSIWAKTVPANARSWGLMCRIGMTYVEGGDFDHPALKVGDPLRRHVLYRILRPA